MSASKKQKAVLNDFLESYANHDVPEFAIIDKEFDLVYDILQHTDNIPHPMIYTASLMMQRIGPRCGWNQVVVNPQGAIQFKELSCFSKEEKKRLFGILKWYFQIVNAYNLVELESREEEYAKLISRILQGYLVHKDGIIMSYKKKEELWCNIDFDEEFQE